MSYYNNRPTTSANRPGTGESALSTDSDPGMFTFFRPDTADGPPPPPLGQVPEELEFREHRYPPSNFNSYSSQSPSTIYHPQLPSTVYQPSSASDTLHIVLDNQFTDSFQFTDTSSNHLRRRSLAKASNSLTDSQKITLPTSNNDQSQTKITSGIGVGGSSGMKMLNFEDEEDSPYPEVRAAVSNYDDPKMPVLTFRTWTIGLVLGLVWTAFNIAISFRGGTLMARFVLILAAYPIGKGMARILPERLFRVPDFLVNLGFNPYCSFNPGPFNIKEHSMIAIIIGVSYKQMESFNTITVLQAFFDMEMSFGLTFMFSVLPALCGLVLSGCYQRFLVIPGSATWPEVLLWTSMMNAIHAEEEASEDNKGMTRLQFFKWVAILAALYHILPGFLFTGLTTFSFACWIAPNNIILNQLMGSSTGLGMNLISLNWAVVSVFNNPMIIPWWAACNIMIGFVFFMWVLTPILYYTNAWDLSYGPVTGLRLGFMDRFGLQYNFERIKQPGIVGVPVFNATAYEQYSPVLFTSKNVMIYSAGWAFGTSIFVYTLFHHGDEIYARLLNKDVEEADVHRKLMQNYKPVPNLWFGVLGVIVFVLSIVMVVVFDFATPAWVMVFALALSAIYVLPLGYMASRTACFVPPVVMFNLIPGYTIEGRVLPYLIFRLFGQIPLTTSIDFTMLTKFGHYMKIPPSSTFFVQVLVTILTAVVQTAVKQFIFANVEGVCLTNKIFSCSLGRVLRNTTLVWGMMGAPRLLAPIYRPLLWSLLVGAIIPIPFWFAGRRFGLKHPWLLYVHTPISFALVSNIESIASTAAVPSFFIVSLIFQYYIRTRHFRWWGKYNFVLGAGLDAGTVTTTVLIFMCLVLPGAQLTWWGNTVESTTTQNMPRNFVSEPIGPRVWS